MSDVMTKPTTDLIQRLPKVEGSLTPHVPMAKHCWFGVGGAAEILFTPKDKADLITFITALPRDIPVFALGAGSNVLIRDGGIAGIVVDMRPITHQTIDADKHQLTVGAGMLDAAVARLASRNNIAGLEFLVGIPGTIGGGLRMNAGAFGGEFRDIVISATAIDRHGQIIETTPNAMNMRYRQTDAPLDWIFLEAKLQGRAGEAEAIRSKMKSIIQTRSQSQPQGVRTGGSTFANPDEGGHAWQLIDKAGCRGMHLGGASVSDKHCNFLINRGDATASDLEGLGEMIRTKVQATSNIALRWEIRRIGSPKPNSKSGKEAASDG
ncbi:MAG: UDP-N-acetylmuramate dehydrogenase [Proteobacteria bacterium]|nr:UDP-N-acetylmuramate dehydrogenase [Pseudomonadota bacterium]